MQTTWIVAADEHRARIFEVEGAQQANFHEIEDFVSPEGRMREQDLISDAKGRYFGKGERMMGHTAEPNVTQTQHWQELFAKQIGEYLDKARMEHRYDKLRLIAFSKFLGMLRKNLSKESQQLVEQEVSKEITGLDEKEIESYIKTQLH
ncbi:MAG TPA: host attachment protein [Noviherbaspirillum sp.]|uniref:host attachment protein n=1 Tax=Noviherbaspirillum sp. TaxID=1926288 RepID=UPI002B491BF7|nr:host attachment protein [Noviherbaspirillum sp.]HJV84927.1 host attachment protein [Noviherbaspirillum sp.]